MRVLQFCSEKSFQEAAGANVTLSVSMKYTYMKKLALYESELSSFSVAAFQKLNILFKTKIKFVVKIDLKQRVKLKSCPSFFSQKLVVSWILTVTQIIKTHIKHFETWISNKLVTSCKLPVTSYYLLYELRVSLLYKMYELISVALFTSYFCIRITSC